MERETLLLLIQFFLINTGFGQSRTISGKVVNDGLLPVSFARIYSSDTVLIATTDIDGNFKTAIPSGVNSFIISSVGMETKLINYTSDCSVFEIILLNYIIYDFVTEKKVLRLEKRRHKRITNIYRNAYEKGIFSIKILVIAKNIFDGEFNKYEMTLSEYSNLLRIRIFLLSKNYEMFSRAKAH